jgi:hypothetical protein
LDGLVIRAPAPDGDGARALGEGIARLAGDEQQRLAMANAARTGAARFDVTRRIDEVVALYRELLVGSA